MEVGFIEVSAQHHTLLLSWTAQQGNWPHPFLPAGVPAQGPGQQATSAAADPGDGTAGGLKRCLPPRKCWAPSAAGPKAGSKPLPGRASAGEQHAQLHATSFAHTADSGKAPTHCCVPQVVLQVFRTFAGGFGEAYKPLLTEIQETFDASIQQGLQDSLENATLRQQLLQAASQQAAAEDAAVAEVISGQSPAARLCE